MPIILDEPGNSSTIDAFGYDIGSQTLSVRFKSGDTHNYFGMPAEVVSDFRASDSRGKFLASQIRGKYESEKQAADDNGTAWP